MASFLANARRVWTNRRRNFISGPGVQEPSRYGKTWRNQRWKILKFYCEDFLERKKSEKWDPNEEQTPGKSTQMKKKYGVWRLWFFFSKEVTSNSLAFLLRRLSPREGSNEMQTSRGNYVCRYAHITRNSFMHGALSPYPTASTPSATSFFFCVKNRKGSAKTYPTPNSTWRTQEYTRKCKFVSHSPISSVSRALALERTRKKNEISSFSDR